MTRSVRTLPFLLGVIVCALPIQAQSWDTVRGVQPGERVKVREIGGNERKGTVVAVTPEAIALATGKTQVSLDRARVKRVQIHSGTRRARNIAIGAGIGLALGVVVDQTLGQYLRNEVGDSGRPLMYVIPIGLFGGIGAAMSPYRTIYRVK
jgi:hypothetical protein